MSGRSLVRDDWVICISSVTNILPEVFAASLEDPRCKHIFLAAWRRPLYLSMLQTHSKKVTLVEGSGMGPGAKLVPLPCTFLAMPTVFSSHTEHDLLAPLISLSYKNSNMAVLMRGEVCLRSFSLSCSIVLTDARRSVVKVFVASLMSTLGPRFGCGALCPATSRQQTTDSPVYFHRSELPERTMFP